MREEDDSRAVRLPDVCMHGQMAAAKAMPATQAALLAEIARLTELTTRHALAMQWLQRVPDDVLALLMEQIGKDVEVTP